MNLFYSPQSGKLGYRQSKWYLMLGTIDQTLQKPNMKCPSSDKELNRFYSFMHAVRKEESTTTKLRAVFDASSLIEFHCTVERIIIITNGHE